MTPAPAPTPLPPASASVEAAYDAVARALTRTTDALKGFETMVEKAEPEFRPVAERFRALHARHATELAALLAEAGRKPDSDGSFMGTVNRAVVATRAFFDRIDDDVLQQVISGEESVTEAYHDALKEPLTSPERDRISALASELQALVAEMRLRA